MSPEQRALVSLLARARGRAQALRALRAVAAALGVTTVGYTAWGRDLPWLLTLSIAAASGLTAFFWRRISNAALTRAVERSTPDSRNLVLTATELIASTPSSSAINARVFADAANVAAKVNLSRTFPATWTACAVAVAVAVAAGSIFFKPSVTAANAPVNPDAAAIEHVVVDVVPPEYSGRPEAKLRDPERIEAFAGSRVRVRVSGAASKMNLETIAGSSAMTAAGTEFIAEVPVDGDGYLAVVPVNAHGTEGPRRLIGVSVIPDRAPSVRVTAPGRDLRVADGRRTLGLAVSAEDDLGLATLRLRFTRVSGSGENFSFSEGEVPLALTTTTSQAWSGAAQWALAGLNLEPGDLLIYRAAATDRRPGATPVESDAFIVEVAAAGASAADGFAIDDREDRYAISQQMVIVKTERLLNRRAGMPAPDFASEALDLAAEQRQVRAEFVFMLGGELADAGLDLSTLNEEVEAAGEDDLAAGRLANQGRADILRAIRSMSRAAAKLSDGDVPGALPLEKDALTYLQRAFSKSRYILRTLGARERIDLSRRMTGLLAALGRDQRPAAEAHPSPRLDSLRRLLADAAGVSLDPASVSSTSAQLNTLAQRALEIDPASAAVRDTAQKLTGLATAISRGRGTPAMKDEAVAALAALVRQELPDGLGPTMPAGLAGLAGALTDALRAGGGR